MRTLTKLVPLVLFGAATAVQACGSITQDTPNADGTGAFPVKGVIRGTVTYSGPAPCSQNGHIVGNAILLVFDRRNPPPPAGLANTAVNFVSVPGDKLFASQPRTPDDVRRCPDPSQIVTASAPYAIAPMEAGSYAIQGFYDYTGDFLPTFKIRNLPEATDVGGGYIDINDATSLVNDTTHPIFEADGGVAYPQIPKNVDPNYQPVFLPVDIGVPGAVAPGSQRAVPLFTMPPEGFVRDNVAVTIGARLPLARPYFYPEGAIVPTIGAPPRGGGSPQTFTNSQVQILGSSEVLHDIHSVVKTPGNPDGDPGYEPVLTISSAYQPYAQPTLQAAATNADVINEYQTNFPELVLHFGVPAPEHDVAVDTKSPSNPFHMQLDGPDKGGVGNGGIFVWWDGTHTDDPTHNDYIPESPGQVQKMWPLVVLAKLIDDPTHGKDPQEVTAQGADLRAPVVIIQGITLAGDSLLQMAQHVSCIDPTHAGLCSGLTPAKGAVTAPVLPYPDPRNLQDHVTVLVRPSALCFDPTHIDNGAMLVVPHLTGNYPPSDKKDLPADGGTAGPVVDPASILGNPQLKGFLNGQIAEACMPPGRYGINVVYPTGQAWTVPNEAGHCAILEGVTNLRADDSTPGSCGIKVRPVLNSQGTRAVVEIVDQDPNDPSKPNPFCHDGVHDVPNASAAPAP